MGTFGVCAGVCGCTRVRTGMPGCEWVCVGYVRGVRRCAWVYEGVRGDHGVGGCGRLCTGGHKCAGVCTVYAGVCRIAWVSASVCVMNSQNNYWRIESLHQRTLIRILYEFFF